VHTKFALVTTARAPLQEKEKEKERRWCKHYRHGLGKEFVLCSAPPDKKNTSSSQVQPLLSKRLFD